MAELQSVSGLTQGVKLGFTNNTTKSLSCSSLALSLTATDLSATYGDLDIYYHKYLTGTIGCLVIKKGVKPPDNWWENFIRK